MMTRVPMKPFLVVWVGEDCCNTETADFDTLDEAVAYAIESDFVCRVIYAAEDGLNGLNVEQYS